MKILFVSKNLIQGNLALQLQKEGHKVKLYIEDKDRKKNLANLVKKTKNWKKELKWVGKQGLIIFDDVGYGRDQDKLRREGFIVFGGGEIGDLLEIDRVFADSIFKKYGLKTTPIYNFYSIESTISFLEKNKGPWVFKQNGSAPKHLNYVGVFKDNRDMINVLQNYKKNHAKHCKVITLQRKIEGIEIATSRYFNGDSWVGPVEINLEHKKFIAGNIGPTTSEMGTIAWYDANEKNKLFSDTLSKLKPFLKKINYRGVIDINCIVNENGAYPLEVTARLGSPIAHLQHEAYFTQWKNKRGDFFYSIAAGNKTEPKIKKGFGIVILVAVPPFPYTEKIIGTSFIGQTIYLDNLTTVDLQHIHFEEVSFNKKRMEYYISDDRGYILYVTAFNKDVKVARKSAYELIKKIHIPKMIYRNDIGEKFVNSDMAKLRKMKYL
jgi:phosphoribosylamine--glycine ligase